MATNFFMTAVTAWAGTGLATILLFFLVELAAGLVRDPARTLELQKIVADLGLPNKFPGMSVIFRQILWWPPFAALLIRAFRNKRTGVEQSLVEMQERQKTIEREILTDQLVAEGKLPVDRQWEISAKDDLGTAHVCIARFSARLPIGALVLQARITHAIWERPDGKQFLCYRMLSDPSLFIPLACATDRAKAFALCDDDHEWVTLCAPGKEEDCRRTGLEQMARFTKGNPG